MLQVESTPVKRTEREYALRWGGVTNLKQLLMKDYLLRKEFSRLEMLASTFGMILVVTTGSWWAFAAVVTLFIVTIGVASLYQGGKL